MLTNGALGSAARNNRLLVVILFSVNGYGMCGGQRMKELNREAWVKESVEALRIFNSPITPASVLINLNRHKSWLPAINQANRTNHRLNGRLIRKSLGLSQTFVTGTSCLPE